MNQNAKLDIVEDALKRYTSNFKVIEKRNPMLVSMNGKYIAIYVENIVKANAPGKKRLSTRKSALEKLHGIRGYGEYDIAVIGIFGLVRTFVAWEPEYILALKVANDVMVPIPKGYERDTTKENPNVYEISSSKLRRSTYAIAMDKTVLGAYLENIDFLHSLDSKDEICSELVYAGTLRVGESTEFSSNISPSDNGFRKKITCTRESYRRDPTFRKAVLDVYGHACCVCGCQLEILHAAHIIPHCEESSTDTVENGLAMCPEHHALYDEGLLLPDPDFKLRFNRVRASELRKIKRCKGIKKVSSLRGKKIAVPNDTNMNIRQLKKNLTKGLECRFGKEWKDYLS